MHLAKTYHTYAEIINLQPDISSLGVAIPLPHGRKSPPPAGTTGRLVDPERIDYEAWRADPKPSNAGLVLYDGVIGVDVDVKPESGVRGDLALAQLEQELGPLPKTWRSSARTDGVSGIRLFRVPEGSTFSGHAVAADGSEIHSIDIIQHTHRYMVLPGSYREDLDAYYSWHDMEGTPSLDALPELPKPWLERLSVASRATTLVDPQAASKWRSSATEPYSGDVCPKVRAKLDAADLAQGNRHNAMLETSLALHSYAAAGHRGAMAALDELQRAYYAACDPRDNPEYHWRKAVERAPQMVASVTRTANSCSCGVTFDHGAQLFKNLAQTSETPSQRAIFDPVDDDDYTIALALLDIIDYPICFTDSLSTYRYVNGSWSQLPPDQALLPVMRRAMALLPQPTTKDPIDKTRSRVAKKLRNQPSWARIVKTVQTLIDPEHPLYRYESSLGSDPYVLHTPTRVIDLRTGSDHESITHETEPFFGATKIEPKEGPTPLFDRLLDCIAPSDATKAYLLALLAKSLDGVGSDIVPVLFGDAGSGKTTLLRVMSALLGDYATQLDSALLGSQEPHKQSVLALRGKRFVLSDEAPPRSAKGVERLKSFTGGGPLQGNRMHGALIEFLPSHMLWFASNDAPYMSDAGLTRRYRLFDTAKTEDIDAIWRDSKGGPTEPGSGWHAELPHILHMLIQLYADLSADWDLWLTAPEEQKSLVAEVQESTDSVVAFVSEATVKASEPANGEQSSLVYKAYRLWCKDNGIPDYEVVSMPALRRRLERLGYAYTHTRSGKKVDITITASFRKWIA